MTPGVSHVRGGPQHLLLRPPGAAVGAAGIQFQFWGFFLDPRVTCRALRPGSLPLLSLGPRTRLLICRLSPVWPSAPRSLRVSPVPAYWLHSVSRSPGPITLTSRPDHCTAPAPSSPAPSQGDRGGGGAFRWSDRSAPLPAGSDLVPASPGRPWPSLFSVLLRLWPCSSLPLYACPFV